MWIKKPTENKRHSSRRKNSIYKKIPLKKKGGGSERKKESSSFKSPKRGRYVDPCPSGNRGSQVEIHGARKSDGPALIWIGHARTLIFQPSVKSKTGWLSQDSSKAQFRRVSSFSPSTTCPFPFRLIHRRPAFTCISGGARNKNARIATLSVLPR